MAASTFLYLAIALCGAIALLFVVGAARAARQKRIIASGFRSMSALCFGLGAIAAAAVGGSLLTYERLTHEQLAVEVHFDQIGDRHFQATLTYPSNREQTFELRGDQWQIDARLLKWHGLANLAGFDTVYRLERIAGRYENIDAERRALRTVYALHEPARVDAWSLARRVRSHLPWVDALYGSAAFLPMADGALYQVTVSQSGLVARPLNQAARNAVAGWR